MYIKENILRLISLLLIIIFAGALIFSIKFLKNQAQIATNPSPEVMASGALNIDQKTLDSVLKKVQ